MRRLSITYEQLDALIAAAELATKGDAQELHRQIVVLSRGRLADKIGGQYPINPRRLEVHALLDRYRDPNSNNGWRWNKALDFIADHMPTTATTVATVLNAASEQGLVSRIPGIGATNFARLQGIFWFNGEYDNNNAGESPARFNKFMREYGKQ